MSIDNQGRASRVLPFPLKEQVIIQSVTSDGIVTQQTPQIFPVDSDEKIDVIINLSLNEYVALASAIDVGRDIGYGINSQEIWWVWVRALIGVPVLTCEQIIDCIENDPNTQQALAQYLLDAGFGTPNSSGIGTPNNPGIYQENPLLIDGSTIVGCGNDNLFGAITQFIDFINRRIVDVFEIIEVETNAIERSQIALSAFPITDTLGGDEALSFADQLIEEIAEGYAAAFTEELEDEYRCDLFCLVKDTCELDFETFANYFNNRIAVTPPDEQFSNYIEWFIAGTFSGSNIVDAAYSLVCSALSYGSSAFGINIGALLTSVNAALNDPNSDWLTLCDDCGGDFPVIINNWCTGTANFGTVSQDSDNVWTLTATLNAGDGNYYVAIHDMTDRKFAITNINAITPGTGNMSRGWTVPTCTVASFTTAEWIDVLNLPGANGYIFGRQTAFVIQVTVSEVVP